MEITGSQLHQDVKRSQENNHRFQFASENKLATVKRAALLTGGGSAPPGGKHLRFGHLQPSTGVKEAKKRIPDSVV